MKIKEAAIKTKEALDIIESHKEQLDEAKKGEIEELENKIKTSIEQELDRKFNDLKELVDSVCNSPENGASEATTVEENVEGGYRTTNHLKQ